MISDRSAAPPPTSADWVRINAPTVVITELAIASEGELTATIAAIVTPPYTSMATLAGYPDFGNTFDVRDLQGGLVARLQYLHERREQARAMIRATLRSMESIVKNEAETVAYLHRDFALEPKIAADTYRILKQIVNTDGDIEEPVLKTILEKLKQESGVIAEVPLDRLVDLSLLREVKAEVGKK